MKGRHQDMPDAADVQERDGQLQVSRRGFIEIATGSVALLPLAAGGFIMPFSARAEAAELDAAAFEDELDSTTHIVIARSDQVGVVVADMTNVKGDPLDWRGNPRCLLGFVQGNLLAHNLQREGAHSR